MKEWNDFGPKLKRKLNQKIFVEIKKFAGHALNYAFDWKMTKHGAACRREGLVFLPMPVESLGGTAKIKSRIVLHYDCSLLCRFPQ